MLKAFPSQSLSCTTSHIQDNGEYNVIPSNITTISSGEAATVTFDEEGTYAVQLEVSDDDGDSNIVQIPVVITDIGNLPPVAKAGGPYRGLEGQSFEFDGGFSHDDGQIVGYEWDFGDGTTGTGVITSHTYIRSGTYTVTLLVTDDQGATDVDTTVATVQFHWGHSPANLMPNHSFETHTDGDLNPDGWALWDADPAWEEESTQQWISSGYDSAHTGWWSCRLAVGSKGTAMAKSPRVKTLPGQLYYAGAWIKDLRPASLVSAVPAKLRIEYYDSETEGHSDGNQTYDVALMIPPDAAWFSWHLDYVQLNPSTTHPWVQVVLLVENESDDGGESAYVFDDIWFSRQKPTIKNQQFTAIAAGSLHSMGLKANGSLVGWGYDHNGEASPPDGNDFIAVDAGDYFSMALKADGSIMSWGYDGAGQASPPIGNDFVAIDAGSYFGLALKSNGSIVGWGRDMEGQIDTPADSNFTAVAAGRFHGLALKADGTITQWGDTGKSQGRPPSGHDFVAIAAGHYHSLALKSDGSIVQWGSVQEGQAVPPEGNDFIALAAGWYHSVALKADGSVVAWGEDSRKQARAPEGNDFIAVAAGGLHSLALDADGAIVGWGFNDYDQTMPPTEDE